MLACLVGERKGQSMKVLGFIRDAILDPQRRKHVISRIIEGFLPTFAIVFLLLMASNGWYWPLMGMIVSAVAAGLSTVGQFLLYEFVLEPLGKTKNPIFTTGRYWERGPREDETFKRP